MGLPLYLQLVETWIPGENNYPWRGYVNKIIAHSFTSCCSVLWTWISVQFLRYPKENEKTHYSLEWWITTDLSENQRIPFRYIGTLLKIRKFWRLKQDTRCQESHWYFLCPHVLSGDLEIHFISLVQSSWENRSKRNFSVDDFNIFYKFSDARMVWGRKLEFIGGHELWAKSAELSGWDLALLQTLPSACGFFG